MAVDTAHVTAERYGITNVPSVVWVDEDDRIVKPPTIAPGDDQFVEFTKIESEQHHEALRRWVREGVLPESASAEAHERTDAEQRALAERRVAAHLQRQGDTDGAKRHLAAAQELAPWDWTVRRGRDRDDRRRPVPRRGVHVVLGGVGRLGPAGLHADHLTALVARSVPAQCHAVPGTTVTAWRPRA